MDKSFLNKRAGFGLIEMMVSISIMVLVISVVMAKHNAFSGAVLLRSQAYEVALQVRETQLGAVGTMNNQENNFRVPYGVHFEEGESYYRPFIDNDTSGEAYYFDAGEEFGKRSNLDKRFVIDEIRLVGAAGDPDNLSVVFERPNFDAKFNSGSGLINATAVEIDVRVIGTTGDGTGKVKTVEILRTGQITVK